MGIVIAGVDDHIKYLIEIGSSTIKIVERVDGRINCIGQKTLAFRKGFTKEAGISQTLENELVDYLKVFITNYNLNNQNTRIYATGVFRDILDPNPFISRFFDATGLYFNTISRDLEAFYYEKAWVNDYSKAVDNLLVIIIGGKTTELLLCHNGKKMGNPIRIEFGVVSIYLQFPDLNNQYSKHSHKCVVDYAYKRVKELVGNNIDVFETAIYTGGELKYMQRAGYDLRNNTVFTDPLHPSLISIKDFENKNEKIFSEITLEDLKNMMPESPIYMEGARPCSVLAEAICRVFGVQNIIPSDTGLLDGVNLFE